LTVNIAPEGLVKTVTVLNRKGGCAKTSTCFHASAAFASRGLRVLLLDLDPQSNLSQGLLGPEVVRKMPSSQTLAAVLGDAGAPPLADLVVATSIPGVSLLPGSDAVEQLNVTQPETTGALQYAIRDALDEVTDRFDIALCDCPPNVQLCSWAALVASDAVLVPVPPEDFGALGLVSLRRTIKRVQSGPNPRLRMLGYLLSMANKALSVHAAYESDLRAVYGDDVFAAVVPLAKDYKEAVLARKPVGIFKPKSPAAQVMLALADEIQARLVRSSIPESEEAA
jgi:chromosome partitioning protein